MGVCAGYKKDGGPCNAQAGAHMYCHHHRGQGEPLVNMRPLRDALPRVPYEPDYYAEYAFREEMQRQQRIAEEREASHRRQMEAERRFEQERLDEERREERRREDQRKREREERRLDEERRDKAEAARREQARHEREEADRRDEAARRSEEARRAERKAPSGGAGSVADEDMRGSGSSGLGTEVSKLPDSFRIKWTDLKLEKNKSNKLGKGGFGTVYRGVYLTEPVAIKVVDFGGEDLPSDAQSMFWKEVQLHYSIRHPNVVTVLGAAVRHDSDDDDEYAIILELMPGGSLWKHMERNPAMTTPTKLKLLKQLASGLTFLHARDIVHRDLKPDNVLIDSAGNAKLSDFGLSYIRKTSQTTGTTRRGMAGTPGYIDPAIFLDATSLTKESDVFSFAIMAWEIMCRQKAFGDLDLPFEAFQSRIAKGLRPPVDAFPSDTPAAVQNMIQQAWALPRAMRPTMEAIKKVLEPY